MLKFINLILIAFAPCSSGFAKYSEFDEIQQVFLKANHRLENNINGQINYKVMMKYFQDPEVDHHSIKLLFDRRINNLDSLSGYMLSINGTFLHIALNSNLFIINTNTHSINVYSVDTINNNSFSRLVSSCGQYLFKPFATNKKNPFRMPKGYIYQTVLEENLYGEECFKISFASLDSLIPALGYDSAIYHFRRSNYDLLRYERVLYDTFEMNTQRIVYDSITYEKSPTDQIDFLESYLSKFQKDGYTIIQEDPYSKGILPFEGNQSVLPNWIACDNSGKMVELSKINSKLILFDFSYLSCHYCMSSLPMLNNIFNKYDRSQITVCWIDPYDFKKKEFLASQFERRNIKFPVYYDIDKSVSIQYGISTYPYLFLVEGKSLKLIESMVGYSDNHEAQILKVIEEFLNK